MSCMSLRHSFENHLWMLVCCQNNWPQTNSIAVSYSLVSICKVSCLFWINLHWPRFGNSFTLPDLFVPERTGTHCPWHECAKRNDRAKWWRQRVDWKWAKRGNVCCRLWCWHVILTHYELLPHAVKEALKRFKAEVSNVAACFSFTLDLQLKGSGKLS